MGSMLKFGKVKHHHLNILHGWIRAAGWKDDFNQVKAMFAYTPDNWVAAELDEKLVGLGALRVGPKAVHGGYGYTMTAPEFSGNGIIRSINNHVDETYSSVNLYGNAEPTMIHFWEKFFPYLSDTFAINAVTVRRPKEKFIELPLFSEYNVTLYEKVPHFQNLVAYDQKIHITDRAAFLNVWLHAPTTRTCLAFDKRGHICGYGCVSHLTKDLSRIAPLFANNSDVARAIYERLMYAAGQGKEGQGRGHVEMALVDKERTWPLITEDFEVVKHSMLYRLDLREKVTYDLSRVYAMTDLCLSYV